MKVANCYQLVVKFFLIVQRILIYSQDSNTICVVDAVKYFKSIRKMAAHNVHILSNEFRINFAEIMNEICKLPTL